MNIIKLTSTVIFSLIIIQAQCQSTPQKVLGSFVYNNKTYNYEFLKESEYIFTFTISTLNDSLLKKDSSKKNAEKKVVDTTQRTDSTQQKDTTISQQNTTHYKDSAQQEVVEAREQDTGQNKTPIYRFSEFSQDVFESAFLDQLKTKYNIDTAKQTAKNKAIEIFFAIKRQLDFLDDEPVTAYFILKKDNIYSFLKTNSSVYYNGSLSKLIVPHHIQEVSVETEDGAIKNLTLNLVDPNKAVNLNQSVRSFLEFKNQYPISISGKFDAERFADINLYCTNCAGIQGLSRYVKLSDLLTLSIVLENDKEDYSPSNRKVSLSPSNPIVELRKEKRSRILEVSAFTDFVGLDQEQPNGLIQIEAKRKININTKSALFSRAKSNEEIASKLDLGDVISFSIDSFKTYKKGKIYDTEKDETEETNADDANQSIKNIFVDSSKHYFVYNLTLRKINKVLDEKTKAIRNDTSIYQKAILIKNSHFHSSYYNLFGYIEPKLLFSKLEENNRIIDSSKVIAKKINPLLIYQYQLVSFGASVNIARFSFPQQKFNWNVLNVGLYWFRARIYDSSINNKETTVSIPLNGKYWQFNTNVVFRPDSRWGASMSLDYIMHNILNPTYSLTNKHNLLQTGFDAYLKTNDDSNSKLFFRYRWIKEIHNRENNFTQIQLGYSLNLFANKNTPDEKKQ